MKTVLPYVKEYKDELVKSLKKEMGVENPHAIPKLSKIVVSVGIGSMMQRSKDFSSVEKNLALITGQKPIVRKSKKAISNFKLREGMPVGLMVTLRGKAMYGFLKKLVTIVLPRVRDFRGLSTRSFDGLGNYSIGLKEHTVFPEIKQEDDLAVHGIQITFSTTANNNKDGLAFMKLAGLPFQKK